MNQEIDDVLDGIERYAPHAFPEENQHEQSERNEYITSPIPCTQEENKAANVAWQPSLSNGVI